MQQEPTPTQPTSPQGSQLPPVAPPTPPQSSPATPHDDHISYQADIPAPVGYAASPTQPSADESGDVTWEASEYIHNAKGKGWVVIFLVIVALLVGVAIWLSEWTFAVLIIVMAVAMGIFAFRPPRVVRYTLTDAGVRMGGKTYFYNQFRAFGILQDGAFFTMTLIPVQRFSPALSVYFSQDMGEQIVNIVGAHLPMETIQPDLLDIIMRRLRF